MQFRIDPAGMARVHQLVERAKGRVVEAIAADARRHAPVDTGELLASIDADPDAGIVSVGTDHWAYQEYGTEHQPGTRFMRPALYTRRELR